MNTPSDLSIEPLLDALLGLVERHVEATADLAASLIEFFGPTAPASDPGLEDRSDRLARRRHAEWFLLERVCDPLDGVPIQMLRGSLPPGDEDREALLDSLQASFASVFEVGEVRGGQGAWVQDLAGGGEYALHEPEGSLGLETGDLLVGRLLPMEEGSHRISSAAGVFRNPELAEAVRGDLTRARESRRGTIRIAQSELEALFFAAPPEGNEGPGETEEFDPLETLEQAQRELLAAGIPRDKTQAIFDAMARDPLDANSLTPGRGDLVGEVLDELAFETEVDLEQVRAALVRGWGALSADPRLAQEIRDGGGVALDRPATAGHTTQPIEGGNEESLADPAHIAEAIAAFDRARAEGGDLESIFQQLESDLGLEPSPPDSAAFDAAGAPEEIEGSHPDFPGVVAAMVEEFLWDRGRVEGTTDDLLRLRTLGECTRHIGVFEELNVQDLIGFLAFQLPERGLPLDATDARGWVDSVGALVDWLVEQHELEHLEAAREGLLGLGANLPRVAEINRDCAEQVASVEAQSDAEAELGEGFEVLGVEPSGRLELADRRGDSHVARVGLDLAQRLRAGDRLRARLHVGATEESELTLLRCYPPESSVLEKPKG